MTTAPQPRRARPGRRRALRFVHTLRTQLTRQFITRNRRMAFVLSVVTIAIAVASVHVSAWWFSPGVMILPILAGGLLLWPRALRIFFGFAAVALIYDVVEGKAGAGIIATIVLTAVFADVLARTREKLGVQGLRGDRMLLELRDRIRAQGKLPELGEGWGSSLVLKPAGGSSFGGDFVVSFSDGKMLEVALVDVSGKGIDAGTRALLLSGAFGGLLGSVPREEFLPACNAYMRRGAASEGFVTAVHLSLDLATGEYVVSSAGHPPAVHYDGAAGRWRLTRPAGSSSAWCPTCTARPPRPSAACCSAATRSCSTPTAWSKRPAGTSTWAPTGCSARPNACWPAASAPALPLWSRPCSGRSAAPTTAPWSSSGGPERRNRYPRRRNRFSAF